jgi:hypothetical protein
MRKHWLVMAPAALCVCMCAQTASAQDTPGSGQQGATPQPTHWYSPARYKKYNPVNLFHRDSRSATEELAENTDENKKLSSELQSLLPPRKDVKDVCTVFKSVEDCVAAIHASHNVGIKFECLKWNVTAVKPNAGAKSCSDPETDRPMTLERAIRELKPDADAKYEAKNAVRKARENIADARS